MEQGITSAGGPKGLTVPSPYSPVVEAVDLKFTQRWFESNYGYVPIAQLVEQQTFNLRVDGSRPSGDTNGD